jgi:hypothetical protein
MISRQSLQKHAAWITKACRMDRMAAIEDFAGVGYAKMLGNIRGHNNIRAQQS